MNPLTTYRADLIRAEAGRRGFSQSKLAKLSGVNRPTVHKLWQGKLVDVQLTTLHRIANALNIAPTALVADHWQPETKQVQGFDYDEEVV